MFNKEYGQEVNDSQNFEKILNTPYYYDESTFAPRYYQRIAINRTVEAIAKGQDKVLLVMATGTGKTYMAFQIIWRLWKSGLKKKILYLADRNVLIDQTITGDFKPFKNSMYKVEKKTLNTSYEIYLSLYQQLSENGTEDNLALLKENFQPDFFDLIIVDECHRGSAKADSAWRKILDYFSSASKIGMTATPKENRTVSNIDYFGQPIYTYSLKDGIEDGFLAPFKVIRYALDVDVYGFRPEAGKRDVDGDLVEDREYGIKDYDKNLVIDERTKIVAKEITDYLKRTDRFAKTIVFCVDIDHAERMRRELINLNSDLCRIDQRYVMRITGDDIEGKRQLDNFIDPRSKYPTIVTTSKLLTTGVNCKTCKNIVLENTFGEEGMTEFKQIIGRGTRISERHNKMFFTILDFRNASKIFADPAFNGPDIQSDDFDPSKATSNENKPADVDLDNEEDVLQRENLESDVLTVSKQKVYINGVCVKKIAERIQYYDKNGKLITESLKDFTKRNVLGTYKTLDDFLKYWTEDKKRNVITAELESMGVFVDELKKLYPVGIDVFDLICDIAYGIKPLTKSQRAKNRKVDEVLSGYSRDCKAVLSILLEKYAKDEVSDIRDERALKLPEFNSYGNPVKIIALFGGKEKYLQAVSSVQKALYIA